MYFLIEKGLNFFMQLINNMNNLFKKHKLLTSAVQCNWSRISRFLSENKKFYKEARICHSDGGFEINLDARKLRSPNGVVMKVPSEGLAYAVALEWNSQQDIIRLDRMPLTVLCFASIDSLNDRSKESFIKASLKYLSTDTVLCHPNEPPELAEVVQTNWNPVIDWLNQRYDLMVKPAQGFEMTKISPETYDVLSKYLQSYDYWSVVGFETMTNVLKSVILSLAVMNRHIDIEHAVSLSRLEQEYQISKWGNVAWYHDIELMYMRMKTSACALFIQLCSEGQNYSSVDLRKKIFK